MYLQKQQVAEADRMATHARVMMIQCMNVDAANRGSESCQATANGRGGQAERDTGRVTQVTILGSLVFCFSSVWRTS